MSNFQFQGEEVSHYKMKAISIISLLIAVLSHTSALFGSKGKVWEYLEVPIAISEYPLKSP